MSTPDSRTPSEHDCDRILYSDAFRRLGEVTQVFAVGEKPLFHTRMTHTLKVQQLSRRIAEQLNRAPESASALGGAKIDEAAAEAAGAAHDLGHPPFGHIGETVLNGRCVEAGLDGFEGNAQTFRILTKIGRRGPGDVGMSISPVTLRAVLKYPWMRTGAHAGDSKWNAYRSEKDMLEALTVGNDSEEQSTEASIMDWADDITYAVHDLEDFVRVGLVPLRDLANDNVEMATYLEAVLPRVKKKFPNAEQGWFAEVADNFAATVVTYFGELAAPRGAADAVSALQMNAGRLIGDYVSAAEVTSLGAPIAVPDQIRAEVELLKQLTWHYVIHSPGLATMQEGQQRILGEVFDRLATWLEEAEQGGPGELRRLPTRLADLRLLGLSEPGADTYQTPRARRARAVADYIASLTERQCLDLSQRLLGGTSDSALDPWLSF